MHTRIFFEVEGEEGPISTQLISSEIHDPAMCISLSAPEELWLEGTSCGVTGPPYFYQVYGLDLGGLP